MTLNFQGPDRIEMWEALGRPIRRGSPEALAVSDLDRVQAALAARDGQTASTYLGYLRALYDFMMGGSLEWALLCGDITAHELSADAAQQAISRTLESWRQAAPRDEASELVSRLLAPQSPRRQPAELIWALTDLPTRTHARAMDAIGSGDFAAAQTELDQYAQAVRRRHDSLVEYIWVFASVLERVHGQSTAENLLQKGMQACSFYEPMAALCAQLAPGDLASILAEHLRAHFSGSGRKGAVRIIEEPDRYRLVFEPCGTGGAMRQAFGNAESFGKFHEPSPATWSRSDGVPAYCTHCAHNELATLSRLGHPAWVTEYDPDPKKPCGWTIYKQADAIPDIYYTRLGKKKPVRKEL